jgi:hypothetical protein
VYHGATPTSLRSVAQVSGVSSTIYTVGQLGAGTHYFAVSAITATGAESALSQIGSKNIP